MQSCILAAITVQKSAFMYVCIYSVTLLIVILIYFILLLLLFIFCQIKIPSAD